MAISSRYIRVHQDALVEWIQDDSFFYEDEYSIIKDTLNGGTTSFCFSKNAVNANNYNKLPNQLYLIDQTTNKFGIADPDSKSFLLEQKYANNAPSKFDKVKIWFPVNWTFPNLTGMYLNIASLNYENSTKFNLCNFFLDSSNSNELNKLDLESQPLRIYDRLWGKSITLYVPSVYAESNNRTNGAPTLGSINYNLTNGIGGLSTTSPIFIDFRYLYRKDSVLNQVSFYTLPKLTVSIPQTPEYNNLTVQIQEATDGDYFLINGLYNSSISEFDQFMTMLDSLGKRSYVLYSITTFEEGLPQDSIDIYVYKDFYKQFVYKPVFMFTNTTASIQVEMKLINSVDGSVINKLSDLTLVGSSIGKYGKLATPINISNAIKPKLYNSKPDNIVLPNNSVTYQINKKSTLNEVKYIPYPVLTNVVNIIADQLTTTSKGENYFGFGGLELALTPFDNIIKIRIAQKNGSDIKPMNLPSSGTTIQLVFKSSTSELRVPMYMESNEVDLINGVLVFKILASQQPTLKKIQETNKTFYITFTTNSTETSIYDGKWYLLNETTRITSNNTNNLDNNQNNVQSTSTTVPKFNSAATGQFVKAPNKLNTLKLNESTSKKILDAGLSYNQLKLVR